MMNDEDDDDMKKKAQKAIPGQPYSRAGEEEGRADRVFAKQSS
jgi:hypothetical protein